MSRRVCTFKLITALTCFLLRALNRQTVGELQSKLTKTLNHDVTYIRAIFKLMLIVLNITAINNLNPDFYDKQNRKIFGLISNYYTRYSTH